MKEKEKKQDSKTENLILGILNKEPVTIDIILSKPNFFQKLFKKKSVKHELYPVVLSDLIKITKLLNSIPKHDFENKDDSTLFIESIDLLAEHADKFLKIIQIITGAKLKMLSDNLTTDDILKIIQVFVSLSNVQNFLISIALTRATASLKS